MLILNTDILPRCRKDREMKNDVRVWWNVDRKESEEEKEELFSKRKQILNCKTACDKKEGATVGVLSRPLPPPMKIAFAFRWAASAAKEVKQIKENSQRVGKIIKYLKSPRNRDRSFSHQNRWHKMKQKVAECDWNNCILIE